MLRKIRARRVRTRNVGGGVSGESLSVGPFVRPFIHSSVSTIGQAHERVCVGVCMYVRRARKSGADKYNNPLRIRATEK